MVIGVSNQLGLTVVTTDGVAGVLITNATPTANAPLLRMATGNDADRWTCDEDGDVTQDGDLTTRSGKVWIGADASGVNTAFALFIDGAATADCDLYLHSGDFDLVNHNNPYNTHAKWDLTSGRNSYLLGTNRSPVIVRAGMAGIFSTNVGGVAELYAYDDGGNYTLLTSHVGDTPYHISGNWFTGVKWERNEETGVMTKTFEGPTMLWEDVEERKRIEVEVVRERWDSVWSDYAGWQGDPTNQPPDPGVKPLPYVKRPVPTWLVDRLKQNPYTKTNWVDYISLIP
jgi:hypothetical protein